jgi:4-amino-4-deoxy-L-arabinose transferase-like glycosyltransferase
MNRFFDFLADQNSSQRRDLILLGIFFGVLFLQLLGHFPLIDPDEGRYAEIPREMLERGDLITPMLNYVKYFEKPVLLYWLNALSFTLFGENEFAARLACALSGLGTVLFTYHLGREFFDRRTGLLATLVLGTGIGFLIQSRFILTDIPLTFTMVVSLGCYGLAAVNGGPKKTTYYYLAYLFAGLAVLSKGLIGMVLPGAVIFWHIVLTRRWQLLKEMRLLSGLFLFMLVTAPWFILVSVKNPEFARFFFIHEHFTRFLTKVHGRYQPFWYFMPVLLVGMMPWSFLIPAAVKGWWRNRREAGGEQRLFLVLWAGLIFIFFSKSNSKLPSYILPIFPPLALLIASLLNKALTDGIQQIRRPAVIMGVMLTLLGLTGCAYPFVAPKPEVTIIGGLIVGGLFMLQGLVILHACRAGNTRELIIGAVTCSLAIYLVAPHFIFPRIVMRKSYKPFGAAIRQEARPGALLVSQEIMQGLNFYAQRRMAIFGYIGEIEFGRNIGDQSEWFFPEARFFELWQSPRQIFAITSEERLARMPAPKPRILVKGYQHLLITNQ